MYSKMQNVNYCLSIHEGIDRSLAIRYCQEHHLYRYEGLSVGLQVLLPRGEEREGADALGGGEAGH